MCDGVDKRWNMLTTRDSGKKVSRSIGCRDSLAAEMNSSGVRNTPIVESPPAETPLFERTFALRSPSRAITDPMSALVSNCRLSRNSGTSAGNLFPLTKKPMEARKYCFFCLCSSSELSVTDSGTKLEVSCNLGAALLGTRAGPGVAGRVETVLPTGLTLMNNGRHNEAYLSQS